MFTLHDLKKHLVDLRRSEWDKTASNPKAGDYKFKKKVYVRRKDYNSSSTRPKYVFKWVGFQEEDKRSGYYAWKMYWDASPVVAGEDDFWPEPLKPDASGHYRVLDALLVKIPLEKYMEKVKEDRAKSDRAAKSNAQKFASEARRSGALAPEDDFIEI